MTIFPFSFSVVLFNLHLPEKYVYLYFDWRNKQKKKQIDHPINENENQIKWMKRTQKRNGKNRTKMKNKEMSVFLSGGVGMKEGLVGVGIGEFAELFLLELKVC